MQSYRFLYLFMFIALYPLMIHSTVQSYDNTYTSIHIFIRCDKYMWYSQGSTFIAFSHVFAWCACVFLSAIINTSEMIAVISYFRYTFSLAVVYWDSKKNKNDGASKCTHIHNRYGRIQANRSQTVVNSSLMLLLLLLLRTSLVRPDYCYY